MTVGLERQAKSVERIYRRFPDAKICGFYQMRTPNLMICDPALINTILIKDFSYFTDHGVSRDQSVDIMGRSLFFAKGQKWKTMRQKLSPGFTSGKLKGTYEQIRECSDQMLNCINKECKQETDGIEVNEMVNNLATDIIGTCAFGMKLDTINSEQNLNFKKYAEKLIKPSSNIFFFQNVFGTLYTKISRLLNIQATDVDATNFFHSVFKKLIDYRTEHNVDGNDIAQTLMKARNDLVLNSESAADDGKT